MHLIYHEETGIFAMSVFRDSSVPAESVVSSVSCACLIMYQQQANNIKFCLCNPDLGLKGYRDLSPFKSKDIQIKLRGKWELSSKHSSVHFVKFEGTNSVFKFVTKQGISIEVLLSKVPEELEEK